MVGDRVFGMVHLHCFSGQSFPAISLMIIKKLFIRGSSETGLAMLPACGLNSASQIYVIRRTTF